jgi:GNAT superfamily N-acetyltransferase
MIEISAHEIERYAGRMTSTGGRLAIASVAQGNTGGRLWLADRQRSDSLGLLWDHGNKVFHLFGEDISESETLRLRQILFETIRPQALARGWLWFKLCPQNAALSALAPTLFAVGQEIQELHEHRQRFYRFEQERRPNFATPKLEGLQWLPIDRHLLEDGDWRNVEQVRDEVAWMWPSLEPFYAQGLGIAACLERTLVCWCTAEYVSQDMSGIGIATATAARFVGKALRRGLKPYWECNSRNLASQRVAEKVGFTWIEESRVWFGKFAATEP